VPAAAAAPGRLSVSGIAPPGGSLSRQDGWPPADVDDRLTGPLQDLRALLAEHPELAADPDLELDVEPDGPAPAGPEVLKAGFWDRDRGDGAGFAAGGVTDRLPPGPALAGFAADAWDGGLARASDDELIGVLRAARRLASWATALELAAVGDLWRRRVAEEEAGDTGAALHLGAEIAATLTLTNRACDRVVDLAIALRRLPLTSRALAAGDIDVPRAVVIAGEVTGLTDEHAALVERAVIGAAPGQTTGKLGAATRRAVIAADPTAARKRKEQALRGARVERWDEHAGTAALAGRDLPPAAVLAADQNLTALAKQLKAAGTPGTLDMLRARVYLALLTGAPVTSLPPAGELPGGGRSPAAGPASGAPSAHPAFGFPSATGTVNLTLPLATWLGISDAPGHCAGYGPLDATDSRALAEALASQSGNRWCLTFTDPGGRPVLHGCARAGSPPGRRRARAAAGPRDGPAQGTRDGHMAGTRDGLAQGTRDGPTAGTRDGSTAGTHDRPEAGARDGPTAAIRTGSTVGTRDGPRAGPRDPREAGSRDGPRAWHSEKSTTATWDGRPAGPRDPRRAGSRDGRRAGPRGSWTFTFTLLTGDGCDHAWETLGYRPSPALRHLIEARDGGCVFPGCGRPASQCDLDHTVPYDRGGRTCLCNLAPLCRRHHEAKQAPGWRLEQPTPGTLIWTTPTGRRYPR
jgi:Domain of unknown function (DUF222)